MAILNINRSNRGNKPWNDNASNQVKNQYFVPGFARATMTCGCSFSRTNEPREIRASLNLRTGFLSSFLRFSPHATDKQYRYRRTGITTARSGNEIEIVAKVASRDRFSPWYHYGRCRRCRRRNHRSSAIRTFVGESGLNFVFSCHDSKHSSFRSTVKLVFFFFFFLVARFVVAVGRNHGETAKSERAADTSRVSRARVRFGKIDSNGF